MKVIIHIKIFKCLSYLMYKTEKYLTERYPLIGVLYATISIKSLVQNILICKVKCKNQKERNLHLPAHVHRGLDMCFNASVVTPL